MFAVARGGAAGEHSRDDLHPVTQHVEAGPQGRKVVAVRAELRFVPSGAKSWLKASVRNVVDRNTRLCQERRIAKRDAEHQTSNPG